MSLLLLLMIFFLNLLRDNDYRATIHFKKHQYMAKISLTSLPPSLSTHTLSLSSSHSHIHIPHTGAYKSSMNAVLAKEEYNNVLEEVKAFSTREGRRPRILVAKMGQDGKYYDRCFLLLSLFLSLTLSLYVALMHTPIYTLPRSLLLSLTLSLAHFHSVSLTHIHILSLFHTLTFSHSLTLSSPRSR